MAGEAQTLIRFFATGAEAWAWRASMGMPKASLHFVRGRGWRMQLYLEDGAA